MTMQERDPAINWDAMDKYIDRVKREMESEFHQQQMRMFVQYEVVSTWWARYVSGTPLQNIVGKYFAQKVKRKYMKMLKHRAMMEALKKGGLV